MRWAATSLALTILAATASPAAAHRFPPDCAENGANLELSVDRLLVREGDTARFAVSVHNDTARPCEVSPAQVSLYPPGPSGTPAATGIVLDDDLVLPAGLPPQLIATRDHLVELDDGVADVVVGAELSGTLHVSPADADFVKIQKELHFEATQPRLELDVSASPATGVVPLTVTYTATLSNTSTTPVGIRDLVVDGAPCTPGAPQGDDGDGVLSDGETWRLSCTRAQTTPLTGSFGVIAHGMSTVDGRPVSSNTATVALDIRRPPRPVLTLVKTAAPESGFAPLAVTYSYVVANQGPPGAHAVADLAIEDPGCAPAVPAASGPLPRGDTRTFTCALTLARPGDVFSSAVARGTDAFDGTLVNSAPASAGATALAPPAVLPAPAPVPDPAEPAPPKASDRVTLTVRGRFARPCRTTATVRVRTGRRTVAGKRVRLDRRCRYRARLSLSRSRLGEATRVTVTVRHGRRTKTHRLRIPGG